MTLNMDCLDFFICTPKGSVTQAFSLAVDAARAIPAYDSEHFAGYTVRNRHGAVIGTARFLARHKELHQLLMDARSSDYVLLQREAR